uniref:Protein with SprT-like domain at the N terminus n=1 Tax=Lepeophtheirus salmonis TaxID=72036 RepID=A0A0K2T855_LEPSM
MLLVFYLSTSFSLSVPLLKLRPRKDLVETLLHEMIHAYLFVTDRNDNHDGHGPEFHKHMYRINKETGTKISVYHSFHDEVNLYKQHWWKCDGPCVNRRPFFGLVKRSMNRAPGRYDNWFAEHQRSCGGTYHKIKEPEGYGLKKKKDAKSKTNAKKIIEPSTHQDIRSLFSKQINNDKGPRKPFSGQNIVGFGGTSYASTSTKSDKWSNNEASSSKTSSLKKTNPATSSTNVSKSLEFLDTKSESETNKSSTSNLATPNFNPNCDNSAQRQTVRDIWIKKFSTSGDGSTIGPLRKKFKSTFESSRSNEKPLVVHKNPSSPSLDSSVEIIEETKNTNTGSNTKIITQSEVSCPICNETFVERAINAHLDICLER